MSVVEATRLDLTQLGVTLPDADEHQCLVDETRLGEVVRAVTEHGSRLVIDKVRASGEVAFTVIDAYVGPTSEATENLPPQCSF